MNFNMQFKKLAYGLSVLFSIIMFIMFLVTSSLMADLYRKFCDYVQDINKPFLPVECGEHQRSFMTLPLFGYFTMIVWVRLYIKASYIARCIIMIMYIYVYI